jgi:hypothetical protein
MVITNGKNDGFWGKIWKTYGNGFMGNGLGFHAKNLQNHGIKLGFNQQKWWFNYQHMGGFTSTLR